MTFRFKPEEILLPSEDADVVVRPLAGSALPILVVDEFYAYPDRVRSLLDRLPHPIWKRHPETSRNFEDYMDCRARFDPFWYGYAERIAEIVSAVWDLRLATRHEIVTNNFLAINSAGTEATPHPHSDSWDSIATVVCLNEPAECSGGTAFYRSKETGRSHAADDPELYFQELKRIHVDDNLEDGRDYYLSNWSRFWQLDEIVPMKWNRAIIYPGLYFHGAWQEPGAWREYPRVNQVLFQRVVNVERGWLQRAVERSYADAG